MPKKPNQRPAAQDQDGYSRLQIVLHWGTAALILLQLVVNEEMRAAFRTRLEGAGIGLPPAAALHLAAGLLILAMTVLRLGLRLRKGPLPPPEGGHPLLVAAGEWAHRALYALLFFMTLTGTAAWFLRSETAAILHEAGRLALIALILLHILGALAEHFVIGNRVIRRMLRAGGQPVTPPAGPASATPAPEAKAPARPEPSP